MSFPSACCNTPPVKASYTPRGEKKMLGDAQCYVTGSKESKRGIIINYDIFGFHANVIQLSDILAELGFYVILPDLLRGKPLTVADMGNPAVFGSFVKNAGSWETNKPMYAKAMEHMKENGISAVGFAGFCWGGKMVLDALAETEGVAGGAIVHPALIQEGDFSKVKAPLMVLPTKDDPDLSANFEELKSKPFFSKCYMERFDDMFHGFCGARGDWSNQEQAKRANDAIKLLGTFFVSIMPEKAAVV
ncbi:hypothetical protein IW140_003402 [Coemansia sp. RSA 1813]|nr:hypothetical protein EV178_003219 [Coemansia sp. RSA 1646]KAJ1771027.1 hypothetical protein LPJ74_002718 [Coemansia sp. RSA 1843]KAJ2089266.1 hypothetical protein IW138_003586 [Coemansia sp. RSA 986]KAJ2215095.1 hypothetical protein EV179_002463 [Coemansia sp. RSA 487]KAJ2569037.1 hypothetical protein IW140_003402 [Coemansia sp. RSA 1813]